jgi:hypothetical protein
MGSFVADFLCYEARLIVEADGGQHGESSSDAARDTWFSRQGFRVLRFWNNDILKNPEGVVLTIAAALGEQASSQTDNMNKRPPHPAASRPPSPAGGEGYSPAATFPLAGEGRSKVMP